jgi:hypothetical protein
MSKRIVCVCALVALLMVALGPAAVTRREPAIEKSLQQKVAKRLVKAPLSEVVVQYAKLSGLKIRPDWEALEKVGVRKDTKVLLKVAAVTFQQLLDLTVSDLSPKSHPLAWYVDDGVVIITTQRRVLFKGQRIPPAPKRTAKAGSTDKATRPRPVDAFNFDGTGLADVLGFLRDVSDVNFHIHWASMEAVGVTKDTPVSIKASNITIERALDLVTDQVSGTLSTMEKIYWIIDDGVVMIATGEKLNTGIHTRVYDVADVLMTTESFVGPRMNLDVTAGSGGSNSSMGSGGGGGGGLFEDEPTAQGPSREELRKKNEDALLEIIKITIGEEWWHPNGKGTIKLLGNKMIISQTRLGFRLMEKSIDKNWLGKSR